ncbi:MAG: Crp/Fnr family transcriptional regulator [Candidatus Sumerlaeia bacterium]
MKSVSAVDKIWHIKQCPLFSALSPEEMHEIESSSQMFVIPKNKVLPPPPGNEPSLFVIKKGFIQLTYTDVDGKEAVVILLGPGDVFGSLEPTDPLFGEYCRAVSEAYICRISRSKFEKMLHKYPELAFRLTKFSLLRINRLQVRLAEMMMRKADERLALALLDLDKQVGRDEANGQRRLALSLTHADLAKLIGTSREMVTILLKKFRNAGLVEAKKGWLFLKDRKGLQALASHENE